MVQFFLKVDQVSDSTPRYQDYTISNFYWYSFHIGALRSSGVEISGFFMIFL